MTGLSRGATIVVTVLAVALATAGQPAAADAAPRDFYGVSSRTPLSERDFKRMGDGRVGTLRSLMSWAAADPTNQDGDINWAGFDVGVAAAAREGITVQPFIFGTPDWVAKDLDGRNCASNCVGYAPRSPGARAAFADFLGAAVDRYGPGGDFWAAHPELPARPIRDWQIWNEQNSRSFYAPRPSIKGYAKLLGAAAAAIRTRDRGADVILGGMAALDGSRKAVSGPKYLKKLYRRGGVKRSFDGLAVHPYGARLGKVVAQVDRFRDAARRARDGRVKLWISEIGWGSASGGNPLNVGRAGQASRLRQAFDYFAKRRGRLNVQNVTWFSWRDSKARICDWCPTSGLFTKGGRAKPSWRAFRRAAR